MKILIIQNIVRKERNSDPQALPAMCMARVLDTDTFQSQLIEIPNGHGMGLDELLAHLDTRGIQVDRTLDFMGELEMTPAAFEALRQWPERVIKGQQLPAAMRPRPRAQLGARAREKREIRKKLKRVKL